MTSFFSRDRKTCVCIVEKFLLIELFIGNSKKYAFLETLTQAYVWHSLVDMIKRLFIVYKLHFRIDFRSKLKL